MRIESNGPRVREQPRSRKPKYRIPVRWRTATRTFLRLRLLVSMPAALVVLAGVLITGCASSATRRVVNAKRVDAAITTAISRERHQIATVTCPTGIALRRGMKFYCAAQVGQEITPFRVTQTDSSGHVSFVGVSAGGAPGLPTQAIAGAIGALIHGDHGTRATVRCPIGIPRQRGLSFVCSATGPGRKATLFEVRQLNGHGRFSYRDLHEGR
jgi:hypothetical protein